MIHHSSRTRRVIMDYKTLFSDINVANEVLFAEDEEKGCVQKVSSCLEIIAFFYSIYSLFGMAGGSYPRKSG